MAASFLWTWKAFQQMLGVEPVADVVPVASMMSVVDSGLPGAAAAVLPTLATSMETLQKLAGALDTDLRIMQTCFIRAQQLRAECSDEIPLSMTDFVVTMQDYIADLAVVNSDDTNQSCTASSMIVSRANFDLPKIILIEQDALRAAFRVLDADSVFCRICQELYECDREFAIFTEIVKEDDFVDATTSIQIDPDKCFHEFVVHVLLDVVERFSPVLGYLTSAPQARPFRHVHAAIVEQRLGSLRHRLAPLVSGLRKYAKVVREILLPAIEKVFPCLGTIYSDGHVPPLELNSVVENVLQMQIARYVDPAVEDIRTIHQLGLETMIYQNAMLRASATLKELTDLILGNASATVTVTFSIGFDAGKNCRIALHGSEPVCAARDSILRVMQACASYTNRTRMSSCLSELSNHHEAPNHAGVFFLANLNTWTIAKDDDDFV
jgi:hypothetical protein